MKSMSIWTIVHVFLSPTISEEVFASNGAIWWSSTGKYLAYAEFNDSEVHKVEFPWYGAEQYPETVAVPYPKVRFPHALSNIECSYLQARCSLRDQML